MHSFIPWYVSNFLFMFLGVFGQYILPSSKRYSWWHHMVWFYAIVYFLISMMIFVLPTLSLYLQGCCSEQVGKSGTGKVQSPWHSFLGEKGGKNPFCLTVKWTLVFGQSDARWPGEYYGSCSQPDPNRPCKPGAKQPFKAKTCIQPTGKQSIKAENTRLLHEALQRQGRPPKSA